MNTTTYARAYTHTEQKAETLLPFAREKRGTCPSSHQKEESSSRENEHGHKLLTMEIRTNSNPFKTLSLRENEFKFRIFNRVVCCVAQKVGRKRRQTMKTKNERRKEREKEKERNMNTSQSTRPRAYLYRNLSEEMPIEFEKTTPLLK